MDDHKTYYDPRDLWPLLVRAGFRPQAIRCLRHKFGLNTFAVCQGPGADSRERFAERYLRETVELVAALDADAVERASPPAWPDGRERGGRLFILGVGGSAGHASHAVNDFRKICGIEAYAPTDNVSELTARTNDEGWDTTFSAWLRGSRLGADDARAGVLGRRRRRRARRLGQHRARARRWPRSAAPASSASSAATAGTRPRSPTPAWSSRRSFPEHITPHTEGLCAVIWHLLVSHPALKARGDKWEIRRMSARRDARDHRRRRRLHRQPLHRRLLGDAGDRAGHGLRQLLLRPGVALAEHAGRPAAGGRARRRQRPAPRCATAMAGHDLVIHLASNPDIAAAVTDPAIDFDQGTLLTHHVVEAMRRAGVAADRLRLGQRRLRRPRRARGRRGPRPAGAGLDLRRAASWPARR